MKSNSNVIRALTVEFTRQFIRPFVLAAIGILMGLLLVIGVLAFTVSHWWWLLAIPVVIIGLIGVIIWWIVRLIASRISPDLDADQTIAIRKFIDKLKFVIETVRTPYPIIIFYVVRDIILRKEDGFIKEMIMQSKSLRPDYEELKKMF